MTEKRKKNYKLLEGLGAAPHRYIKGERSPLMVAWEFGKVQIDL